MNLSHRRILVRGLFVLALLAGGGLQGVSAQTQTTLPPCTAALNIPDDGDSTPQAMDIDKDGDGLIEICDLEGLNEIRFQPDGLGYTTGTSAMGAMRITTGCPSNGGCTGYELTKDLDFMDDDSYRPESTNQTAWTDTSREGWDPIGTFNARFNGNSHTISNLRINRTGTNNVGLFGVAGGSAEIANLGLLNVIIVGRGRVGSLVGWKQGGSITSSYAMGSVTGGANTIGGLVGWNNGGSITNSYATGNVTGTGDNLGGLVGTNTVSITNSYATGEVSGRSQVGGLVGNNQSAGSITNSYATGNVTGTGSNQGGLVGLNVNGTITRSYWLRDSTNVNRTGVGVNANTLRTMTQLQSPTTNEGIYTNWLTGIGILVAQFNIRYSKPLVAMLCCPIKGQV